MAPNNRSRSNSTAQRQANRSVSPLVNRQPSRHAHRSQPSQNLTPLQNPRSSTPKKSVAVPPAGGMSPTSRYNHNFKVIKRRVPSIVALFDQFHYVCLYHSSGSTWEKRGFEGSMFLFEREEEPKYGFVILNRMGMDDYVQFIGPNDVMLEQKDFLIYYDHNATIAARNEGREHEAVGLWTHATDDREPLALVMMRLLDYVKRGERYPDQYRYLPGSKQTAGTNSADSMDKRDLQESGPMNQLPQAMPRQQAATNMTDLDMLFSKLTSPPPAPPQEPMPTNYMPEPAGGFPNSQPYMAFEEMPPPPPSHNYMGGFNMPMNPDLGPPPPPMHAHNAPGPGPLDIMEMLNRAAMPIAPPPINNPPHPQGPSLLNSIFASVVPPMEAPPPPPPSGPLDFLFQSMSNGPPPNQYQPMPPMMHNGPPPEQHQSHMFERQFPGPPPHQHHRMPSTFSNPPLEQQQNFQAMPLDIHSPKPTSAALPQILTNDVIQQLMGMQTSPLVSSRSSVSSVGGEQNAPAFAVQQQPFKEPAFANGQDKLTPGMLPHPDKPQQPAVVNGDATPRAHSRVVRLLSQNQDDSKSLPPRSDIGQTGADASKMATSQSEPLLDSGKITHFPSSSELWPHDQSPWKANKFAESVSMSGLNGSQSQSSESVVELDFADVGSLNDIKAFEAKVMTDSPSSKRSSAAGRAGKDEKQKERSEKSPASLPTAAERKGKGAVSDVKASASSNGHTTPSSGSSQDLFSEQARTVILGGLGSSGLGSAKRRMEKKEFVREVLTLIHTDKTFVDRLYDGYLSMA